jgi:hypothetical protein
MSKKKYITDELIEKRLNKQGLSSYDGYGAEDEDEDYKRLCKHYEFELTDQWGGTIDYYLYTETTADGYEIWIATDNGNGEVNVNEDVHYYDNDLSEVLTEWIRYGSCKIYVDDMETYYVTEALETMWENMIDSIKDNIIVKLEDEGYEWEADTNK